MNQKLFIFAMMTITVVLGTVGCNSYKSKLAPPSVVVSAASIDYAFVQQQVFQPYCIRCHSDAGGNDGDINMETYENVLSALEAISAETLIQKSMPPKKAGGALPPQQQEILRLWIEAGAPRNAHEKVPTEPTPEPTPIPTPEVTPTPEPAPIAEPDNVLPTWNDISTKIFEAKCNKCHAEGEKAEEYPFTDRAYVIDPQNLILVPGNIEKSPLVHSIVREDNKRMPPAKTGMNLSAQEIDAIKTWILNGAKD